MPLLQPGWRRPDLATFEMTMAAAVELLGTYRRRDRSVAARKKRRGPWTAWAWCSAPQEPASGSRAVLAHQQKPERTGLADSQATGSSQTTQRLRFGSWPALRCVGVRHDE